MGPMALLSTAVALAPATPSPPAFRSSSCKDFTSESFSLLVPLLPLLTSHVAVFQTLCLLTNMADQVIDVDFQGVVDGTCCGQELQGKSHQLIWNPLEQGTLKFVVRDVHAHGC